MQTNHLELNETRPEEKFSRLKMVKALTPELLEKTKIAYSCRRTRLDGTLTIVAGDIAPQAGNLVLARVDELGQHKGIESRDGRRHLLFPGDLIIVCYGRRYAPDQFEAELPFDLSPCHLVAAGGLAGKVISRHSTIRPPTCISPIGLIGNHLGNPLNIADYALPAQTSFRSAAQSSNKPIFTIAVLGTSMNAGKTTTAAYLIRGLTDAGLKVGAAKITGTGSPRDVNFMKDAGANPVLDFIDAGLPSTYQITDSQLESTLSLLTNQLATKDVEVIVLEIADGLFQKETQTLCLSKQFNKIVDGVIFAAGDAIGAVYGNEWLHKHNLKVIGLSGLFTSSPLAIKEVQAATEYPVFTLNTLFSKQIADRIGYNRHAAVNNG